MGLDQTLNWIGEPSRSQITRLKHKDLSELNYTNGMNYIVGRRLSWWKVSIYTQIHDS